MLGHVISMTAKKDTAPEEIPERLLFLHFYNRSFHSYSAENVVTVEAAAMITKIVIGCPVMVVTLMFIVNYFSHHYS